MRDWLGVRDRHSWDDEELIVHNTRYMQYSVYAVLHDCSSRCMQCSVNAVLGGYWTPCLLMIIAWRDGDGYLHFMFVGYGTVEHKVGREDRRWEIIMQNCDCREFRVRVNRAILIWQVQHVIQQFTTPIFSIFSTQSSKSYPWFLIPTQIPRIIPSFIHPISLSRPQLYYDCRI